jgi:hypothetical protein
VFTETIKVAGVAPLVGLTESQLPVLVAAAVNDCGVPELDIAKGSEPGGVPPC